MPFKPCSHEFAGQVVSDYPFAVVGTLVEHMGVGERPGTDTRYFILDCSNGKTYAKKFGRTYATAHGANAAAKYLKGEQKYAHIATTPLRPTLWTS